MSAIFYHDQHQKEMVEQSLQAAQPGYKNPITTLILPTTEFFDAEE
jgi:peptide methionine sulfoxide reductase MsrA